MQMGYDPRLVLSPPAPVCDLGLVLYKSSLVLFDKVEDAIAFYNKYT